ncbi:MAG: hypothetical protein DWI57_11260 [Chloroflexi bacterium]|nr:MAG: hypothetical protein DWI57_11260 [Chloroflexota bacterium]
MTRTFSSYGPINTNLHYYAPRTALIEDVRQQLLGEENAGAGHYVTVWGPRQTGKSWVMQQVVERIQAEGQFASLITTMQSGKSVTSTEAALHLLVTNLRNQLNVDFPAIHNWMELRTLFTPRYLSKPLILVLDEFDALPPEFINRYVNEFRSIYSERQNEIDKSAWEKSYWLHGLALIGVRGVLGVENISGSPFNVQRSIRIPNLTQAEVVGLFRWYEQESGQPIEPAVSERVYYETQGQPGLTCWLGELLTETYNEAVTKRESEKAEALAPIGMKEFDRTFLWALKGLGNNNILNIVSKAREEPYKQVVLNLFKTDQPIEFSFDDPLFNYLYLNGVVDSEATVDNLYLKFPSPFVQKRLFYAFAHELFNRLGTLYQPFEDISAIINETSLNIKALLRRYERYFRENREWLLKDAPHRSDLHIFEAVYHFNLFMYLARFLESRRGQVTPEFPTGNGQIDLLIRYADQLYGVELKSFVDAFAYQQAITQAVRYATKLHLSEISLVFFVEAVDDENRRKFETIFVDAQTGVTVQPIFVATGA